MHFKDRGRRRLGGQAIRAGCVAFALLVAGVLLGTRGLAYAEIMAPIRAVGLAIQQLAQTTTVEFTPPPSPSPSPSPSPYGTAQLQTQRGGPIRFTVSGSISLGTNLSNSYLQGGSIFNPIGASPSPSPTGSPFFPFQQTQGQSNSSNLTEAGLGANVEIWRRTAQTYTDIKIPIGYSTTGIQNGGTASAIYSTPKYSVGYTAQNVLLFGQLPMGGTLRGFEFILPLRSGEWITYEGPAIALDGEVDRIVGTVAQEAFGQNYYEAGYVAGWGPQSGNSKTLVFGAATGSQFLSLVGEGAWQDRTGGEGSPHGVAFQLRLDDDGTTSGFQTTIRSIPDQFVAFGYGGINSDKYLDVGGHTGGSSLGINLDANWERTGDFVSGIAQQRVVSLTLNGETKLLGYTIAGQNLQGSYGEGSNGLSTQSSNQGQVQISREIGTWQTLLGLQMQRTITGIPAFSGEPAQSTVTSMRGLAASLGKQFGQLGFTLQFQSQRQTGTDLALPTTQTGVSTSFSRQFGKTSITLSDVFSHTISSTSDAKQQTPLLSVTRQISPAIAVGASLGYSKVVDSVDPAADGHSRIFAVTISAPFTIGNSNLTTGHVDPRLPATIVGKVVAEASTSGHALAFSNTSGGGLGNAVITLDDKYVQRTDLTGGFQFSFLTAGQHQLRIDTSSLPRGLTVNNPVVTLVVEGGQTAQVLFTVGNFGAVVGHVYGIGAGGDKVPLQNVKLQIDGQFFSQTDQTGAYGFGGLQAGKHTVEVVESTIPAFATFDPASLKQSVNVSNGQYSHLDFQAQALGSISGRIIYGADVAKDGFTGGVLNAYVVAEPGEHAAIDELDGSYTIDNLPPGDYTVSVDPETLQGGFGAQPDSMTIHLGPGEHFEDAVFTIGRFEKKVVFSLLSGTSVASAPVVHVSESRLPPRGSTLVTVNAPESAKSVDLTVFGSHLALTYDAAQKIWAGEIEVPADAKPGNYSVEASVASGTVPTAGSLTVDPKMPLAILTTTPAHPEVGTVAKVRARFLVDVREGDKIDWEDGTETVLGKPVAGRVFTFDLRISLRPLHGVLLTRQGRLPIELL